MIDYKVMIGGEKKKNTCSNLRQGLELPDNIFLILFCEIRQSARLVKRYEFVVCFVVGKAELI